MQRFQELTQKFTNLSVNKSSHHPTATDSSKVSDSLFGKETSVPSSPVANRNKALPVISNVVVRHSSAFNSERATGMNKVEQLRFVELLKKMIIDEAVAVSHGPAQFSVITSRKDTPAVSDLCHSAVYVAKLIVVGNIAGELVLIGQSVECEFMPDAVENLWEKLLKRSSEVTEHVKVGAKFPALEDDASVERSAPSISVRPPTGTTEYAVKMEKDDSINEVEGGEKF